MDMDFTDSWLTDFWGSCCYILPISEDRILKTLQIPPKLRQKPPIQQAALWFVCVTSQKLMNHKASETVVNVSSLLILAQIFVALCVGLGFLEHYISGSDF